LIEIDYKRWGILRSKLVFFGDDLPTTEGYHFVIVENCFSKLTYHPFFILREKNNIIIDLTKEIEVLFNQMTKMRRRVIKDGLKMDYQITHQEARLDLLREFKNLYNRFIPGKGATPIVSLNHFKALLPYMTIFQGKYEDRTLEIVLLVHDGQTVKDFYNVRDESLKGSKVLNCIGSVLHWEILMYFKTLGYRTFDLGGVVPSRPAIQDYKLSFGGKVIPTYSYEAALTPMAKIIGKIQQISERKIRRFCHRNL